VSSVDVSSRPAVDLELTGFLVSFVRDDDRWEGEGVDEIAYDTKTNKPVVKIDEK